MRWYSVARIAEIAAENRRFGYRRVYLRLRREGWIVIRKRVYRLYREAGLMSPAPKVPRELAPLREGRWQSRHRST